MGQAGSLQPNDVTFAWAGVGQPITQLDFPASAGEGYRVVDVGAGFFHSYALTCTTIE